MPCCLTAAACGRRRCRRRRGRRNRFSRRRGRSALRGSRGSRTGRRSRRTRCSSGAARARRSSATRGSSICCTCGGRRARICTGSASAHPEPLVPLERCHGVRGRLGPDGELEPLDLATLPDVGDAEAVAVCLLFAFRDSRHEAAVAAELRRRHPGVHVVASHEVAPEFREYERASTTAADAYLAPVAARYLRALAAAASRGRAAGAARDAVGGRCRIGGGRGGASRDDPRLRSGGRRRRRGARRAPRRVRRCDRVRHGRHVDRRLPAAGRPGGARGGARRRRVPGAAADRRPAHRRRGRRLARARRRGRRDSRRTGERGRASGTGVLRRGRRCDGHRRESVARAAAGGAAGRARARPRRRRRPRSTASIRRR